MPSPFPGMNPYLEQERAWHDFHKRFVPAAAEVIGARMGARYIVKIDEHVYVHDLEEGARRFVGRADLGVTRVEETGGPPVIAAVLEAPAQVRMPLVQLERLAYLEVRDRDDWRLVTVLELLSPSNKRFGADREQYLTKRAELLASDVHFVELDLLRGGPRLPWEDLPACDYYALVSRVEDRPRAGLWPLGLRDRLPVVPIPVQAPDPDVPFDIRAALDRVYDAARYQLYLYRSPPSPPLAPNDESWAREFVPVVRSTA